MLDTQSLPKHDRDYFFRKIPRSAGKEEKRNMNNQKGATLTRPGSKIAEAACLRRAMRVDSSGAGGDVTLAPGGPELLGSSGGKIECRYEKERR